MVAPSLYPKPSIKNNSTIDNCNKCDVCKNFLIADSKFRCIITGKTDFTKANFSSDGCNVICLITCSKNKKVIGKMKDKVKGKLINEFVRLKSKMYSSVSVDDK